MSNDELDARRYRWIVAQHQRPKSANKGEDEWWRVTIRVGSYRNKAELDAKIDKLIENNHANSTAD